MLDIKTNSGMHIVKQRTASCCLSKKGENKCYLKKICIFKIINAIQKLKMSLLQTIN